MKYFFSITILLFTIGCGSDSKSKPKSISTLSTFKDSTSYALGADLGSNLKQQAVEIDYDVFMAGLTDAMMDGDDDDDDDNGDDDGYGLTPAKYKRPGKERRRG